MKSNPNPYHHEYLGWASSAPLGVPVIGPKNDYACYLAHFCQIREGWDKGDLMGYYPSDPYITPETYWDVLSIPVCWILAGL